MSVNKYNPTSGELELVAGGTLYADTPIGVVQATFDTTAPLGWLLLQGQTISRTEYAELLAWATARNLIGTGKPFGEGDGSTTFVLPDCREATLKGAGLTSLSNTHYDSDGLSVGEFIDDRIKEHQHNYLYYKTDGRDPKEWAAPGSGYHDFERTGITATTGSATNEVKAIGVNYIIKAKQVALPADFSDKVQSVFKCSNSISSQKTIPLPYGFNKEGQTISVAFKNGHNAADSSTNMTLNGTVVVSNQNGTLAPLPIHQMTEGGSTVYKVLSPNTMLEVYYDSDYDGNGTSAWVIVGNPVVLSSTDYTIYADGQIDKVSLTTVNVSNGSGTSYTVGTYTILEDGLYEIDARCVIQNKYTGTPNVNALTLTLQANNTTIQETTVISQISDWSNGLFVSATRSFTIGTVLMLSISSLYNSSSSGGKMYIQRIK